MKFGYFWQTFFLGKMRSFYRVQANFPLPNLGKVKFFQRTHIFTQVRGRGGGICHICPYMQKTCDVTGKAILAKKKLRKKCVNRDKMQIATKVRKSRKSIKNGENRQKVVKIDKKWCYFHLKWCYLHLRWCYFHLRWCYLHLRWCYLKRWLGCSIDFAFSA